jgi:hypothetical protein
MESSKASHNFSTDPDMEIAILHSRAFVAIADTGHTTAKLPITMVCGPRGAGMEDALLGRCNHMEGI